MDRIANLCCRRKSWALLLMLPTLLFMFIYWDLASHSVNVPPLLFHSVNVSPSATHYNELSVENVVTLSSIVDGKWIVLSTSGNPRKQVEALSKLTQWKIVVLGDKNTSENCRNCIFLDTDAQMALGYNITRHLPDNSYARKSIAVLYAIEHGAKVIYEAADGDHIQFNGLSGFILEERMFGLMYNATNLVSAVNPYAHFGHPDIWPRGYPHEETGSLPPEDLMLRIIHRPSIQQGLMNNDQDARAINRLTQKDHNKTSISFDKRAPPVVLSGNVYAPFTSQNTLWHYESFWLMMLPVTTSLRMGDIWRGYWAQRLLQEINGTLGFFPPNDNLITKIPNAHSVEDVASYKDAGRLLNFLRGWTCDTSGPFLCLVSLTRAMATKGFWKQTEVEFAQSWIKDLQKVGYREPETLSKVENPYRDISKVIFRPNNINEKRINICNKQNIIRRICTKHIPTLCQDRQPDNNIIFENILLILEFNSPFYANIEIMESMYGNAFPNRVYCGSWDAVQLSKIPNYINLKFITMETRQGYLGYGCMIRAIEMGYSVDGYLYVSDDVLVKFRGLRKHPVDKMWYFPLDPNRIHNKVRHSPLGQLFYSNQTTVNQFPEWQQKWGRNAVFNSLNDLHDMASTGKIDKNISESFLKRLGGGGIIPLTVWHHNSDAFYIPRELSKNFHEVASVFLTHKVYLGLAVPNLIAGLGQHSPFHGDDSVSVFTHNTACIQEHIYRNYNEVCHRMKLSLLLKRENVQQTFCSRWVNDQLLTTP